jgi:hypothetical protein
VEPFSESFFSHRQIFVFGGAALLNQLNKFDAHVLVTIRSSTVQMESSAMP